MDEKDYIMSDGDFLFNKSAVVDELKDIYTTLDGSDDVSGINSIEAMVEKVAEAAENSGGGGGGVTPTGTKTIKKNGTQNIAQYEFVNVNVMAETFKVKLTNNLGANISIGYSPEHSTSSGGYEYYGKTGVTLVSGASNVEKIISKADSGSYGACSCMFYINSYENIPTGKKLQMTTANSSQLEQIDIANVAGDKYKGVLYLKNFTKGAVVSFDYVDA